MLRSILNIDPLVNEILDRIPQEKIINGVVMDSSMGGGQFMKEVERRKKLAGKKVDFIRKTCYGYTEDEMDLNYIRNKFKLVGQYKVGNPIEEDIRMKFDVVIGNPPFNSSPKKTGHGTGGNVLLYKQIVDAVPVAKNGIRAFITPKGMIRFLINDDDWDPIYLNLMTEKDYWKFNTCYWIAKNTPRKNDWVVSDNILSKMYSLTYNEKWFEINGDISHKKLNYMGPDAIKVLTYLPTAKSKAKYTNADPKKLKVLYGPKFVTSLLSNHHSHMVTDVPLHAKFCAAISTDTMEQAEKIKLFVENNLILRWAHKKLKTKGLVWTMKYLKSFDPDQIVTGFECPKEWGLSKEEIKMIEGSIN